MDLNHRRNASSGGQFVWDHIARPAAKRRASSHASDSERERDHPPRPNLKGRSHRSSTPLEATLPTALASNSASAGASQTHAHAAPTPSSTSSNNGQQPRAATPTLHHSPAPPQHSMNPPQRTPSRRSSFSGSQIGSPPTSATSLAPSYQASAGVAGPASGSTPVKVLSERAGSASRSASRTRGFTPRSPSPAPPLPAIRAPPSPKQRMAVLQAANSGAMGRVGMRLYGDESFSGFFRRLTFSPDGALLVTPTGIFESTSASTNSNTAQTPASPTIASLGREAVSPGSPLLPTHAAVHGSGGAPRSTVYMYARGNLQRSNAPIAHLPGHKTATLVVKFSPILYELRRGGASGRLNSEDDGIAPHPTVPLEAGKQKTVALSSAASAAGGVASSTAVQDYMNAEETNGAEPGPGSKPPSASPSQQSAGAKPPSPAAPSMIGLPYRMVFAVATHDSVWIYDTQQGGPLCCFSNMHYASFTDLTWSPDGQTLMMCSTDGYCSIVVFDYGELGQPYAYQSQPSLQQAPPPASMAKLSGSPMMRRTSAQGVNAGQQATPPSAFGHVGGVVGSDLSPSLGLGLATGNLIHETEPKGVREIDPPVVPAHIVPAAGMPASAGNIQNNNSEDANQARKKRRIAPTLEGPIGS